jgi:hypothetical protein
VISSIFVIVRSEVVTQRKNIRRGTQIGQTLVSVIFYGFGLFAAYRYFALGLQVVCIISYLHKNVPPRKLSFIITFPYFLERAK